VIDVHRREAALVVMGVPECKLLSAMRRAECVVEHRVPDAACIAPIGIASASRPHTPSLRSALLSNSRPPFED
jgi:hypothetical protein